MNYLQRAGQPVDFFRWHLDTHATIIDVRPEPESRPEFHHKVHDLDVSRSVICDECNGLFYGYSGSCPNYCEELKILGFAVKSSAVELVQDVNAARDRRWFHATTRQDWHRGAIEAGITVHVGSMETVRQLVVSKLDTHENVADAQWYLHEVKLSPDADLSEGIRPDLETRWPRRSEHFGYEGLLYVNAFESPGDISVLIKPEHLTPVAEERYGSVDALLLDTEHHPARENAALLA